MNQLRILVEGVGGIGGVVAARLLRAGHDATLVTSNPEITRAVNERGLVVTTLNEKFTQPAQAYTALEDLPRGGRFDAALLLMKAHPVVAAAKATLPYLEPEGGYVVTCQNGIVEDAVAAAVGAERVVSAIIGWGGTMHAPGVYEKTGPGEIHLGELDGRKTERLEALAEALRAVTPVVVTDNIRGALWTKLAINCTITTLGALTGETLGVMLGDRRIRRAFLETYREVLDTALAHGIWLERVAVNPSLLYLAPDAGPLKRFFKDLLVVAVGRKYGRLKSSMLQSLERGRPTEIDYLNGYVVEKAREAGMEVPLNAALVRMVKEIEGGTRIIQKQNMVELLAAL